MATVPAGYMIIKQGVVYVSGADCGELDDATEEFLGIEDPPPGVMAAKAPTSKPITSASLSAASKPAS